MRTGISLVVLLGAGLMGCDMPSRGFRGVDPVRIEIGESRFDVRIKGDRAEAIRRNTQYAPHVEPFLTLGALAIETVSECRATRVTGDQVVIRARLVCGRAGRRG